MRALPPPSSSPHDAGDQPPLVSVVTATYNRSNVLRYAIETVRRQSLANWELLVVGDGCTDDSEQVVAGFGDPRMRFWNLAEPAGEQTGPNNAGCAAARGRFIAFLNHDDFWTPEHLARCVAALERDAQLDLVYGLNVAVLGDGRFVVWGPTASGEYEEHACVPASGWVFRRELVDRVGPWRCARETYALPSQDWLIRAARSGARLRLLRHLSVVSLPSAGRVRSYADRAYEEHARWFSTMTEVPDWEERFLCDVICQLDLSACTSGNSLAVAPFVRRVIKNAGKRVLAFGGVSPLNIVMRVRFGRKGGYIDAARRVRGLPPLPESRRRSP